MLRGRALAAGRRSLSDLTTEQVSLADESRPNDDPFDALICAAALDLDLPLITRDGLIQDWGVVRTVW